MVAHPRVLVGCTVHGCMVVLKVCSPGAHATVQRRRRDHGRRRVRDRAKVVGARSRGAGPSRGRHCHSTRSLTAIGCHCLGI
jgi:hypothetical protein